jgi:hypothetical protein
MNSLPDPQALDEAPELAALAVLDTALAVASNALFAAHRELQFGHFAELDSPGLQAFAADALLLHIHALQSALTRYFAALRQVDASRPLPHPGS